MKNRIGQSVAACTPAYTGHSARSMLSTRRWTLIPFALAVLFFALPGCDGPLKAYGIGRWPMYHEPDAVTEFTGDEKKALAAKLTPDELARVKSLYSEGQQYEALVKVHNDAAAKKWLKLEKDSSPDGEWDSDMEAGIKAIAEHKIGRKVNW